MLYIFKDLKFNFNDGTQLEDNHLLKYISEDNFDNFNNKSVANTIANKKLIAVQLYDILSIFAINNGIFDECLRTALTIFSFQNASCSILLTDFLNCDAILVQCFSVLISEMRAWVDSVIAVSAF